MNNLIAKTKSNARDKAKSIAKQVAVTEPFEVLKTAKSQVLGEAPPDADFGNVYPKNGDTDEVSASEEKKLKEWERKRMQELEEELEKERQKQKKQLEAWHEQQEALMGPPEEAQKQKVLLEPTSKRKIGLPVHISKKQGTREMGKSISG